MITKRTNADGYLTDIPSAVREGFIFGGWFTEPNGKGEQIDTNYQFTSDDTVYAYWILDDEGGETDKILIQLDPDGGVVSPNSILAIIDTAIGTIPTPTKEGFIFLGWFTEKNGAGTKITEDSTFSEATTIYAAWEEEVVEPEDPGDYGVNDTSFSIQDGSLILTDQDGTMDINFDLNGEGHLIASWETEEDPNLELTDDGRVVLTVEDGEST